MMEHGLYPYFSGVPGVPSVPASIGAGLHGTRARCSGVPGVPGALVDVLLEHQEHQEISVVFSGKPHEIRLEHQEHQEHHKTGERVEVGVWR